MRKWKKWSRFRYSFALSLSLSLPSFIYTPFLVIRYKKFARVIIWNCETWDWQELGYKRTVGGKSFAGKDWRAGVVFDWNLYRDQMLPVWIFRGVENLGKMYKKKKSIFRRVLIYFSNKIYDFILSPWGIII